MDLIMILLLIGVVLGVLAAGSFRKPQELKGMSEEEAEGWKELVRSKLPDMEGDVLVLGEEPKEADNVVMPDLWFYRRKDKAFAEAHKWLEVGGKLWWQEFRPLKGKGNVRVTANVAGGEYVEVVEVGGRKRWFRRSIYLEDMGRTDEMCRTAGFRFEREEQGWRCYTKEF